MSRAKLTSKGQITIPIDIRRALGVDTGDFLAFEVQADYVVVRRLKTIREVSADLRSSASGRKRGYVSDDEAIADEIADDIAAEDHSAGLKLVRRKPGQPR